MTAKVPKEIFCFRVLEFISILIEMSVKDMVLEETCRCCLSRGHFKNIYSTYLYMGKYEIYNNILVNCFNIKLKSMNSNAICDLCINQLRFAFKFKEQVLQSEKLLLTTNLIKTERTVPCFASIKLETEDKKSIKPSSDSEDNCKDIKDVKNIENDISEDAVDDDLRDTSIKDEDTCELNIKNNIVNKRKRIVITKNMKKGAKPMRARKNKAINAATLLKNSSACPFRWSCQTGFQCFFCTAKFSDMTELRSHTLTHNNKNIVSMLQSQFRNSTLAKVDITDLKCNLCEGRVGLENLNELKMHLVKQHDVEFSTDDLNLMPFRLLNNDYPCQICFKSFNAFFLLNAHMNCHYGSYICEHCGSAFLSERRLSLHIRIHSKDTIVCKICNKQYPNETSMLNHKWKVHLQKQTYKCHCGEVFANKYTYRKHRIDLHGEKKLLHVCEPCNRSFPRKTEYNRHVRKKHLNERSYNCGDEVKI